MSLIFRVIPGSGAPLAPAVGSITNGQQGVPVSLYPNATYTLGLSLLVNGVDVSDLISSTSFTTPQVLPDTTAPTISSYNAIATPNSLSVSQVGNTSIYVTFDATDNFDLSTGTGYLRYLNATGAVIWYNGGGPKTSGSKTAGIWSNIGIPMPSTIGTYTLQAKVVDVAGNASSWTTIASVSTTP
jgi:hypothetical protein